MSSEIPSGLSHYHNVLSEDEVSTLLKVVEKSKQDKLCERFENRKVYHFGSSTTFACTDESTIQPIPNEFKELAKKLLDRKYILTEPNQINVFVYAAGQGIHNHFDEPAQFGHEIAMLTLTGTASMIFTKGLQQYELHLTPRSLTVLTGDARYKWMHGIPKRNFDAVDGEVVPRIVDRISIVFRYRYPTRLEMLLTSLTFAVLIPTGIFIGSQL